MVKTIKILLTFLILVGVLYVHRGILELAQLKEVKQSVGYIREFTETEKAKMYLLSKTSSYQEFALLREVARCESAWRLDAFNSVSKDGGTFQVNQIHLPEAEKLNLDVWGSWKDNIDFAVDNLYAKSGLQPWEASKTCWIKKNYAIKF